MEQIGNGIELPDAALWKLLETGPVRSSPWLDSALRAELDALLNGTARFSRQSHTEYCVPGSAILDAAGLPAAHSRRDGLGCRRHEKIDATTP